MDGNEMVMSREIIRPCNPTSWSFSGQITWDGVSMPIASK